MKHIHSTGWYPVQNYLLPLIIYSYCISFNIAKVTFKNTILTCWTHQVGCYGKFPTFWFCASVSLCCRLSGSSTLFISCKLELISNGWCACMFSRFSCVRLFVTLRPVAQQAPLSMGFSRQEYWNGLPGSPPGDLPNPQIEPSPSPSCFFCFAPTEPPGKLGLIDPGKTFFG